MRRCLEKSPTERFQSAADVAFYLEGLSGASSREASIAGPKASRRERWAWTVAAGALVAGLVLAAASLRRPSTDSTRMRFSIYPPENASFTAGVLPSTPLFSPDGRHLVYVATSDGQRQLWLRPMGSLSSQPLPGTENAASSTPFWSPDSGFVGFFASNHLKKVDIAGALPRSSVPRRREWAVRGTSAGLSFLPLTGEVSSASPQRGLSRNR